MTDNKIDKVLAVGSSLNWVGSLVNLYKDISNDYEDIYINRAVSANSVKRLLKANKIVYWGVEYSEDYFSIRVKADQADQARSVIGGR